MPRTAPTAALLLALTLAPLFAGCGPQLPSPAPAPTHTRAAASPTASPTPSPTPFPQPPIFSLDGEPYEFLAAFIPGWYWSTDYRLGDETDIQLMESAREAGFSVLRLSLPPLLDSEFGQPDQTALRNLDHFLDQAASHELKVVLCLLHGHAMLRPGNEPIVSPYGIETLVKDPVFKAQVADYLADVVRRQNSINGRFYAEDPTILAWEVIEEPLSGEHNYPERPPQVTLLEVRDWLDEMASLIKSIDPNHPVGASFTSAMIDTPELEDPATSIFQAPNLDFIELSDEAARILQTERSLRIHQEVFKSNKPVVLFLAFDGLSYPDPGSSVPNIERMMAACEDPVWQAETLSALFQAYQARGTSGYVVFHWRLPGVVPPAYDACFSYSLDTPEILASLQAFSSALGSRNIPGQGFLEIRPAPIP